MVFKTDGPLSGISGTNIYAEGGAHLMDLMKVLTDSQVKSELPAINVGDTVRVHVLIKEVLAKSSGFRYGYCRKHGGINETITVRRVSYGVGVERFSPCTRLMFRKSRLSAR